jgi:hypothetical protein
MEGLGFLRAIGRPGKNHLEFEHEQNTRTRAAQIGNAAVLEAIADNAGWSDGLWSQFQALMERAEIDGILADAAEELNRYGGEFNTRNLLLIRVKPNDIQVRGYKSEFRQLASAIRSGTTWEEYKRANRIFEAGDLSDALKRVVSRVLGRVKRQN